MSGLLHPRGTTNTNSRGSSYSRAKRRAWLIQHWGDGDTAPCFFCGVDLTIETVTCDRIIPGIRGGRYVRGNIRPACLRCNSVDGSDIRWGRRHRDTVPHVARRGRLLTGQVASIIHLLRGGQLSRSEIAREVGCHVNSVTRRAIVR